MLATNLLGIRNTESYHGLLPRPTPHLSTPHRSPRWGAHTTPYRVGEVCYSRIALAWPGSVGIGAAGSAVIPSSPGSVDGGGGCGWA